MKFNETRISELIRWSYILRSDLNLKILTAIDKEPMTQTQLAKSIGKPVSQVHRNCHSLIESGLISGSDNVLHVNKQKLKALSDWLSRLAYV